MHTKRTDTQCVSVLFVPQPSSSSAPMVSAAAELDDDTLETVLPVIATQTENFGTLRRWVDSTGQAARQMQELVDEMLTLAAAQRGNDTPPVPVDLSDVVEKAALQLESVAYEKQVTLETELAAHVITVPGSTEALQRIAASLMENAIKYEPSGGSVAVRLTAAKRQVRLEVRNGGAIIPPEALPHMFDRFYRGEKSCSPVAGHGLGLAIVKQLTENLGGSITVRSDETEGTVFLVTLPGKEITQN